METNYQRISLYCPPTMFILVHIIFLTTNIHLQTFYIGRENTEIGAAFLVQTRKITAMHV